MHGEALLKSTITLFAIVNPISSIPLFMQATGFLPPKDRQ